VGSLLAQPTAGSIDRFAGWRGRPGHGHHDRDFAVGWMSQRWDLVGPWEVLTAAIGGMSGERVLTDAERTAPIL
jgi:hypothetical protein